jgi:NAD+ synthase
MAGVELTVQPVARILEAMGTYVQQEEAVRSVIPAFGHGWRFKIVLPSLMDAERMNLPRIVVRTPEGEESTARLPLEAYLALVAATNGKQRTRTALSYYHADRMGYAVCGTPNRLEFDQGFFVKGGDGLADIKPIAHLYKEQVVALAGHLGVPEAVLRRTPTTDTFSLQQSQEEFYFAAPLHQMDVCLHGLNNDVPPDAVAAEAGLTVDQVTRIWADIKAKRRSTSGLHRTGLLVEPISL